jgi:HTH-like domain
VAPAAGGPKWTRTRKHTGRRGVLAEIRQLVVRMAEENPTWGYTRMQGALKNLGHQVGRSTIARILKAHDLPPAPNRPTSWQTFLRAHWGAIAGADFFTTEVWTWRGLVTLYTVFVIDLATRRVQSSPRDNCEGGAGCDRDDQLRHARVQTPSHSGLFRGLQAQHRTLPAREGKSGA